MKRWMVVLPSLLLSAAAAAQQPPLPMERPAPRVTVTLAEALESARQNSPTYRSVLNDQGAASWGVRNAFGAFIPNLSVSSGLGYTGSGASTFGGATFNQSSPSLSSSYGVSLTWQLDGSTLAQPGQQRANLRAVQEDITRAGVDLRTEITTQYLVAMQTIAETDVARQQVRRNEVFLELARARNQVGQATILEVRQAEVLKGQSELSLLRAEQAENEAKLTLFRLMGVQTPAPVQEVGLVEPFEVTEPTWDLPTLLGLALEENPGVRALRAREEAAGASVRSARSGYFPSLSVQAGWRGFTQEFTNTGIVLGGRLNSALGSAENCRFQNEIIQGLPAGQLPNQPNGGLISDCNAFADLDASGQALTAAKQAEILGGNDVFPFNFRSQPFSASLTISLPIFNGFSRELRVSQSRAQEEDARELVRGRELQVRSDVESRWLALQTAWRSIAVQSANRDAAREQLTLAQDRYRVGVGNTLEVTDAQNAVQRAEGDYVTAIYSYHRAIAALEAAAGRTLR
jgi:outer membrane protein